MTPASDLKAEADTLLTDDLKNQLWDFVVIGAGPAGAMAAYLLSPKNRVLLMDQASFPREKSCGGCLSRGALRELERAGLGNLAASLNAKPIRYFQMACGSHSAKISIPEGASLSRKKLDLALIEAAKQKGAIFLSATKGILNLAEESSISISLTYREEKSEIRAKTVFICDGLGGTSLQHFPDLRANVAVDSLVGISTSCEDKSFSGQADTIRMACSPAGYVGIATREDNLIEVAAAVHPSALKSAGSSAAVVENILRSAGVTIPAELAKAKWLGAPLLLRQRQILGGKRFFVLGDAAGFVEPFTGEGMYWALLQARELTTLLEKENFEWSDRLLGLWQIRSQKILGNRKRICRMITRLLRMPFLCRVVIRTLNCFPRLGLHAAKLIHGGNQ